MPNVPQFPLFDLAEITTFDEWVDSYLPALHSRWQNVVFALNALSQSGTIAERPETPELDGILYTATDEEQTYISIAGAWVSLGGPRDNEAFTYFMS